MLKVAFCESGLKQFNSDGTVVENNTSHDVGIFQINLKYHLLDAEKMGIDIYTAEGNVKFAKVLYNQFGLNPWEWSFPCWVKSTPSW